MWRRHTDGVNNTYSINRSVCICDTRFTPCGLSLTEPHLFLLYVCAHEPIFTPLWCFFFPSDIKSWNRWLILWHLFLFIYSCFRDRWFIFIFIRNRHFISRSWRETYKNHLSWNIVWQHNLRSILYIYQFNWYDILPHKFTRNPQINALFMVSRREMQYYVL